MMLTRPPTVIHNTFLEFADDSPMLGKYHCERMRAASDMGMYGLTRHRLLSSLEQDIFPGTPDTRDTGSPGSSLSSVVEENTDSLCSEPDFSLGEYVPGRKLSDSASISGCEPLVPRRPPGDFSSLPSSACSPSVLPYFAGSENTRASACPDLSVLKYPVMFNPGCRIIDSDVAVPSRATKLEGRSPTSRGIVGATSNEPIPLATTSDDGHLLPSEVICTTVMLRNIPTMYTRDMLLTLLDGHGFRGLYDFAYLPFDFVNKVNLGYALVNLPRKEDATRLLIALNGFSMWSVQDGKACDTSYNHPIQGLQALVERYKNSPVMHSRVPDEYKPIMLNDGVRIPFLRPSKPIKAPKIRPPRN